MSKTSRNLDIKAGYRIFAGMSKSIRISDKLAAKAKEAAALFHRSPQQQIEY